MTKPVDPFTEFSIGPPSSPTHDSFLLGKEFESLSESLGKDHGFFNPKGSLEPCPYSPSLFVRSSNRISRPRIPLISPVSFRMGPERVMQRAPVCLEEYRSVTWILPSFRGAMNQGRSE